MFFKPYTPGRTQLLRAVWQGNGSVDNYVIVWSHGLQPLFYSLRQIDVYFITAELPFPLVVCWVKEVWWWEKWSQANKSDKFSAVLLLFQLKLYVVSCRILTIHSLFSVHVNLFTETKKVFLSQSHLFSSFFCWSLKGIQIALI